MASFPWYPILSFQSLAGGSCPESRRAPLVQASHQLAKLQDGGPGGDPLLWQRFGARFEGDVSTAGPGVLSLLSYLAEPTQKPRKLLLHRLESFLHSNSAKSCATLVDEVVLATVNVVI